MANHPVQTIAEPGNKWKVALAIVAVLAGVVGFYALVSHGMLVRSAALIAGLVLGVVLMWTSTPGREFFAFAREAVRETRKVVWPTRKEATQITAVVFAFVLVMAIFLWGTDKLLEFLLYDVILGWKQ